MRGPPRAAAGAIPTGRWSTPCASTVESPVQRAFACGRSSREIRPPPLPPPPHLASYSPTTASTFFSHNSSSPGTGPSTYAAARRPTLPQRPSPGPTPPPPAGPRGTQGYIPAWILVLFVGVASFARYRRGPTLLFVIAAVLFLTASFFTRPKEANVVTVCLERPPTGAAVTRQGITPARIGWPPHVAGVTSRPPTARLTPHLCSPQRQGWSESLPRQFNENAIFNACSIVSETLLFAAAYWAIRHGLVHGIVRRAWARWGQCPVVLAPTVPRLMGYAPRAARRSFTPRSWTGAKRARSVSRFPRKRPATRQCGKGIPATKMRRRGAAPRPGRRCRRRPLPLLPPRALPGPQCACYTANSSALVTPAPHLFDLILEALGLLATLLPHRDLPGHFSGLIVRNNRHAGPGAHAGGRRDTAVDGSRHGPGPCIHGRHCRASTSNPYLIEPAARSTRHGVRDWR